MIQTHHLEKFLKPKRTRTQGTNEAGERETSENCHHDNAIKKAIFTSQNRRNDRAENYRGSLKRETEKKTTTRSSKVLKGPEQQEPRAKPGGVSKKKRMLTRSMKMFGNGTQNIQKEQKERQQRMKQGDRNER